MVLKAELQMLGVEPGVSYMPSTCSSTSYTPSLKITQNRERIKTFLINKDLEVGYEDENFFFLVFLL